MRHLFDVWLGVFLMIFIVKHFGDLDATLRALDLFGMAFFVTVYLILRAVAIWADR